MCAVADKSSAVAGTSLTAATDTSAVASAEPAGANSASDVVSTADRWSAAAGDAAPVASAVSKGGMVSAGGPAGCVHALTSFKAPQKWECSMCPCLLPVGACMQHCVKCSLDYCSDYRPADAEQAAAKPCFQSKGGDIQRVRCQSRGAGPSSANGRCLAAPKGTSHSQIGSQPAY